MASIWKRLGLTVCAAASAWAAGCANLDTIAPGTPATTIEATRGKPYRIWPEQGGAASWEYPTGPSSYYTYMVRVGSDGRVTRVDQVLDWQTFGKLQPGMKVEDVEHMLGRPYRKTYMPLIHETIWTWRWTETIWRRCFDAYIAPDETLVRVGARDEEVSRHGLLTSSPC